MKNASVFRDNPGWLSAPPPHRVLVAVEDAQTLPAQERQQLAHGGFAATRLAHQKRRLFVRQTALEVVVGGTSSGTKRSS